VDDDCNEIAGIRLPVLTVPVATYTGWNLRHPSIGNPELYIGISGGLAGWTLPFPATRGDRESLGAPRLSIEERYITREDYLERVERASQSLVEEGYMLAEDVERAMEDAALRFDHYTQDTN
ncbi:MAG: alpha/beta hydrolase domain-containing protein, partial [Dehalococcoidia bacterium]|nr:alpha/beta hydrolase domain-containing protein [Dehalococcoidia bacterium]